MPPEFRFGYPLEEGTPYPEDREWVGIRVKSDGTRRIDRSVFHTSLYTFRFSQKPTGWRRGDGNGRGADPNEIHKRHQLRSMNAAESGGDTGNPALLNHWLAYPDENGVCRTCPRAGHAR